MPKKTDSKKSTPAMKPTDAETDPLDVVVSTPKKQKKSKSKVDSAAAEVVNVVVTDEVVPDAVAPQEDSEQLPSGQELVSSVLNEFSATLQLLTNQLTTMRAEFKNLSKLVNREMKTASKSRRKRSGGNKQPSGFVKPTLITDELASFLGRENGTEMARTEVTKEINQYIRDNKLQDSDNGRHINPDKKLTKLLGYKKGDDTLTYFNLQKYLSPHFVKTAQPVQSAV